ncbi:RrF2 family transcriptional regulator [Sagittula sp.]|uniref:RrF2 family transcriptional regulator n=1 Tax=Sagittula sp. TaxID=2038081 RepID=UPI00405958A3
MRLNVNRDGRFPRVLHVLIHMALRDRVMSSAEIAQMLTTNPVVVRRMLAGLRDGGLVETSKGPGGGWRVVKSLDAMTLRDVFDALDRPGIDVGGAAHDHPGCPVEAAVNVALADVDDAVTEMMLNRYAATTLAEIANAAKTAS